MSMARFLLVGVLVSFVFDVHAGSMEIGVAPMSGREALAPFALECDEKQWEKIEAFAERTRFFERRTDPMSFKFDGATVKDTKSGATFKAAGKNSTFTLDGRSYEGSVCEIAVALVMGSKKVSFLDLLIPPALAEVTESQAKLAIIGVSVAAATLFSAGCMFGAEVGGSIGAAAGVVGGPGAPATVPAAAGAGALVGCVVGGGATVWTAYWAFMGNRKDRDARHAAIESLVGSNDLSFRSCSRTSVQLRGGGVDLKLTRDGASGATATLVSGNRSFVMPAEFTRALARHPNIAECLTPEDLRTRNEGIATTRRRLGELGYATKSRNSGRSSN